jgi:hypothetical protein
MKMYFHEFSVSLHGIASSEIVLYYLCDDV